MQSVGLAHSSPGCRLEHAESLAHAPGLQVPTQRKNFSTKETMRLGVPQAPFRKRKLRGRDKEGRDVSAVNSFFLKYSFPYDWALLRLREMVRSGSRPGQVRAADLMSPRWGGERRGGFRKVLEKNKNKNSNCGAHGVLSTSLDECFMQGVRASLESAVLGVRPRVRSPQPLSPLQ